MNIIINYRYLSVKKMKLKKVILKILEIILIILFAIYELFCIPFFSFCFIMAFIVYTDKGNSVTIWDIFAGFFMGIVINILPFIVAVIERFVNKYAFYIMEIFMIINFLLMLTITLFWIYTS